METAIALLVVVLSSLVLARKLRQSLTLQQKGSCGGSCSCSGTQSPAASSLIHPSRLRRQVAPPSP
jgi:hypothetical protein